MADDWAQPCSRLSATCTAEYAGTADGCRLKKEAARLGFKRLISFPERQTRQLLVIFSTKGFPETQVIHSIHVNLRKKMPVG